MTEHEGEVVDIWRCPKCGAPGYVVPTKAIESYDLYGEILGTETCDDDGASCRAGCGFEGEIDDFHAEVSPEVQESYSDGTWKDPRFYEQGDGDG